MGEGEKSVKATYGENCERLVEIKTQQLENDLKKITLTIN